MVVEKQLSCPRCTGDGARRPPCTEQPHSLLQNLVKKYACEGSLRVACHLKSLHNGFNTMPHERRHFIRVTFDSPAQLATADGNYSVHVLDLSLKGALVILSPGVFLQPGTLCQLTVPLTSTHDHIAMSTEVAHVEGRCAGLLCRSIDLDSVTHLRRLIELQLGAPFLLDRDLAELTAPPAS